MIALSPRQHQIMVLRARGLRMKEVAHELGISEATVKNHFTRIFDRLGADNATEAYIAMGWLVIPGVAEETAA